MAEEVVASPEPLIDVDPVPAPGADAQKPNVEPASDADAKNPEEVTETPEQQEAKRESRRARSNARKAAELAEARTEARIYREQLEALKSQAKPETGEPQRDQFEDYETYLRAVAKYDAKQVTAETLKTEREARQGSEQQGRQAVAQEAAAKAWAERRAQFEAVTKDFRTVVDEYVNGDCSLAPAAQTLIAESDVGPQVLYHLAANPDVADRIEALSPVRQVAELGKLEVTLSTPAPKKASDAPAPIKHVGQGRSAPNGITDNTSPEEYRAIRKAQGARWAR